jgi:hypothetical protein
MPYPFGSRTRQSFSCPAAGGYNSRVLKWLKFFIAIVLLPVCVGGAMALGRVLAASGNAATVWVPLLGGAACWLVVYQLLPRPAWIYVLGHELTHALWAWLFGGKVKRMKVSSKGGHVIVTKNNFLISLAPYFFPLYAIVVVLVFALGNLFWDWRPELVWFHLLLGAAYAFHVTLTIETLRIEQSDITQHGYAFSGVVIFLGNLALLLLAVPLLASGVRVLTAFAWWFDDTARVIRWLQAIV